MAFRFSVFSKRLSVRSAALLLAVFLSGSLSHFSYRLWTGAPPCDGFPSGVSALESTVTAELPVVDVVEVERLRELAGTRARVRGRVFRVGHSSRSNTYFLDFGPSRSAFTAVIFSSAVDSFLREDAHPDRFQGQEVELTGTVRDDPKYGLQMILEGPRQIEPLP